MMQLRGLIRDPIFYVCIPVLAVYFWSFSDPFFWDTITQSSKRPNFFYTNNFNSWFLPADLDSGHPPGFNWYLAAIWKIFGRTLVVSHLAMLPFILGIIVFSINLSQELLSQSASRIALLLFFLDPTLLAQISLVSADLVLMCGFLMGLYGIIKRHPFLIFIAGFLLLFTSLRGTLIWSGLALYQLITWWKGSGSGNSIYRPVLVGWLLPSMLFGIYLYYHYLHAGWWVISPNPNWSEHRAVNTLESMARTAAVLGWRMLEFGRFFWLIIAGVVVFWKWRSIVHDISRIGLPLICVSFVLLSAFLLWSNPVSTRYLLPIIFLLALMGGHVIDLLKGPMKYPIIIASIISLLAGHLWIYPAHIAQAWDATLAYKPYFKVQEQTIKFMRQHDISSEYVGTGFPMKGDLGNYNLQDYGVEFSAYDLDNDAYILYNTVSNDFEKKTMDTLRSKKWKEAFRVEKGRIVSIIYEKSQ